MNAMLDAEKFTRLTPRKSAKAARQRERIRSRT
jgi:hypothetical protein